MNGINSYNQISHTYKVNDVATHKKENNITDNTKEPMSKEDIISSKDLSPEQKLDMLGIKKMSSDELAKKLADELI